MYSLNRVRSRPIIPGSRIIGLFGLFNENAILAAVSPEKDVDGISQHSLGALLTGDRAFVSCTPLGIIELIDRYGISAAGKRVVVVGRSIILGKPVALLLLNRHATVTICHSKTSDLAAHLREADIVVAAVGRPGAGPSPPAAASRHYGAPDGR